MSNSLSNSAALDDGRKSYMADVRELGRESALGKDSLPRLAMRTVEAAALGYIGEDDGKAVYEEYLTAESKRLVHTDNGKAANASKVKALIKMGLLPIDAVDVIQRAADEHSKMRKEGLKPQPAYAAYISVARAQLASPNSELSDDEIRDAMGVAQKDKTAKDFIRSAAKALEKSLTCEGMTDSERELAEVALARTSEVLANILAREERADKLAKVAELQRALGLAA
jgi:HPt (histidine-containing phosphotransfer) domain-containing protein